MGDFNITVDTRDMAQSLNIVNSNVQSVTNSVIAMESAVVIAQQRASEHICENVDSGFFILMKSQFDQKIAAVSSEMLSKMQLMESFKQEIDKLMLIMADDYDRIKQRYLKHFNSLDKALETRVHELDKKAYEIAKHYKLSQFKTGSEIIKAICYGDDTQLLTVKEMNALLKNRSMKSINVMANDVIKQIKYSESVENIMQNKKLNESEIEYVPLLYMEMDSMISEDLNINDIYLPSEAKFLSDSKVLAKIKENTENFNWKEIEEKNSNVIKNSFHAKVSEEIKDDRVAKEMLRLLDATIWQETEDC